MRTIIVLLILGLLLVGTAIWGDDVFRIPVWGIVLCWIFGCLFLLVFLGCLIWFVLAPKNLFFTFVKEGTAKIVVRGDRFEKALIQWEGKTFNYSADGEERWNVVDIEGKEPGHPFGGLRFYGFWPIWDIYIYYFKWVGVTVDGQVQIHPRKLLDYVLLKDDVYLCHVGAAEDQNLLPLDVELLITMRVVNPYKALFRIQNWNEMIMSRVKPLFREFVAQNTFAELIGKKQEKGGQIYKSLKTTGLIKQFEEDYGILIKESGVEIKDINPVKVEGVPDIREVTLRKYIAEREKERIEVEATADAKRIETVYEAVKRFGDLGQLIRTLEALEESPGQGAKWIIPLPGGADFLGRIFGGRGPSQVISQEIQELKEVVQELLAQTGKP